MKRRKRLSALYLKQEAAAQAKEAHNVIMFKLCKEHSIENVEIQLSTKTFTIKLKGSNFKKLTEDQIEKILRDILSILHYPNV